MKALILTYEKFQDHEVIYPFYALQEHGFEVTLCANKTGKINGILGAHATCDISIDSLYRTPVSFAEGVSGIDGKPPVNTPDHFDLLCIPGGVKALEKLRLEPKAIQFVQEWFAQNKPCMVLCNGPQLLITADVLKNRTCSGYYSIEQDIKNAGATYSRVPVRDGLLVSAAHYDDMATWMKMSMVMFGEYLGH